MAQLFWDLISERQTNKWTDICYSGAAVATENFNIPEIDNNTKKHDFVKVFQNEYKRSDFSFCSAIIINGV